MAYTPPRLEIQQDFQAVPAFTNAPLAALIVGPQYSLTRYASEKGYAAAVNPDTVNGSSYIPGSSIAYPYPTRATNSIVDTAYTKVYFDTVAAQYFPVTALGSYTPGTTDAVLPIGSYTNRLRSTAVVFKTGNGTARSTRLSNRDVQIGDTAVITATAGGSGIVSTKVTGFIAEVVAASTSAVTQGSTNKSTVVESYNGVITGTYANVSSSNTSTAYKGYPALGIVSDTYTATVTASGNLTTAVFSVASANNAFSILTGLTTSASVLTLDANGSNVVRINFTGSTAFIAGQTFVLSVVAPVTQVVPTVSGTYTGSTNLTYTGTIVRGGPASTGSNGSVCAQVYFTSSGTDSFGPVNLATTTAITAGNYGTTMSFGAATNNGNFILGDSYVFTVTAATSGAFQTLLFKDNLPTGSAYTITLAETKADLSIPALKSINGSANWVAASDTVTVNSGIYITDPLLVGTDFTLAQLPITSAKVYIEHRDLLRTNTASISSISDISLVSSVLGTVTPDNPLAQGVYAALLNSNSTSVYYIGINTNDLAGYTTALGSAGKTNKVYGVVPLSKAADVQALVKSHVATYSTSAKAKWRTTWLTGDLVTTAGLYTTTNGSNYTATVGDDPQTTGTQYTLFTVSGATFVTSGIRVGDSIRYNYSTDAFGNIVYNTFAVAEVRSETVLISATALSAAFGANKIEVWRNYTVDEQIAAYASASGSDRRVRYVFPGTLTLGSTSYDSTIACAALAGQRAGVAPQEPLTNIELLGFDGVAGTLALTEEQLNTLADSGIWILTQDVAGGTVYTRHQLTTDRSSIKTQEDQFTTNTDSISYGLQAVVSPFIGKYNITPESQVIIYDAISAELRYRQTGTYTTRGGNQLLGYKINSFQQNASFKDRLDVNITVDEPYPFNNGSITITV